jgi:Lipocalin-like domain
MNSLIGTWRLVSWENRTRDGEVGQPFGEDPAGYITYTENGFVFVAIMRRERTAFMGGDILSGGQEEKAAAAEGYVSYCGRYEFDGDSTVLHHVELSLFPNWVGGIQERLVQIAEDQMTLTTPPVLIEGQDQTAHLVWERVSEERRRSSFARLFSALSPSGWRSC